MPFTRPMSHVPSPPVLDLRLAGWSADLRAIAVAMGCTVAACRFEWPGRERSEPTGEERAAPVEITTVAKGVIAEVVTASSTIEAERQVTVHAEATGRILMLAVEEGDQVKEGQLLARIRYDAQSSQLDRASTSLGKAEAEYARAEELFKKGILSREAYDQSKVTFETALIDVRDRKRDIRNTHVIAPISGTITQRSVSQGGFVNNGAQLLTIVDFDTLVARVYVPEKQLDRIRVGQPADVIGKAVKGRRGTGTVKRIAPVIDAATGTFKVTVGLPRELAGVHGFLPGMYAEVTLRTDHRADTPLLAKQALVHDDDQSYVFVVQDGRAYKVRVEIGLRDADSVEIVAGPPVGAEVVVAGQAGLKDGALVERVSQTRTASPGPGQRSSRSESHEGA